jgi:hypothetical protein
MNTNIVQASEFWLHGTCQIGLVLLAIISFHPQKYMLMQSFSFRKVANFVKENTKRANIAGKGKVVPAKHYSMKTRQEVDL